MILRVIGHNFHYEMENLCRVFFPFEKIKTIYEQNAEDDYIIVSTILVKKSEHFEINVQIQLNEVQENRKLEVDLCDVDIQDECERQMAVVLYETLVNLTGYLPAWGILTGVRPSKLMTNLISQVGSFKAGQYFCNKLLVSKEKTDLTIFVANAEKKIISKSRDDCFSLYISIPFCPSRCNYCSFVSHSITSANANKLLPKYIENLCSELEVIGKLTLDLGIKPQTVYFGGGTPTTLEAKDLEKICETVSRNFNLEYLDEYTVEAGRPDTISHEKLSVLLNYGITRISINPQTFNDIVLEEAGRKHTAECTIEAYKLARSLGFRSINMDLIAGLPNESLESFKNSIDLTVNLSPENITVHTLALKRSSSLVTNNVDSVLNSGNTEKMLDYAKVMLTDCDFYPYYMYRQSRSLGNLENVGWSKTGYEGVYNVFMMEECQTVLAAGAGAVIKLKQNEGTHIERIFNFKYPYEYNSRFNEILVRKSRIKEFFARYNLNY